MPRSFRPTLASALSVCSLLLPLSAASLRAADPKPLFDSKLVTAQTKGHAVDVDVDLNGAKSLYLVVTDGGNGFGADWADWAEPRLIMADKSEKKLTELKWKSATKGWGEVQINKNCEGQPLRINGKAVEYGIGTHANSVIEYELPSGVARFKARAGIDNGGSDQGTGSSVQFLVYAEKPPATIASAAPASAADAGSRLPIDAVSGLDVSDGLEATLFSSEPDLLSPTNIDIDHLGRVWVCEVVNYRLRNGERPEGDRILIVEDTNGDGKADKTSVFYQGRDIDTALGICVLPTVSGKGTRVIVSVAPNVFVFTDDDGDGKADRKETLFSKVGQPQHDHSTHAFLFGPDGKLYWCVGNTGMAVHDKDGKPIVDLAGNTVVANGQPYREGMPFRCDMDGSNFEVLGWNFRNNYEVTVDSFGTLWQSDNDDDGNRGVRINYVMEFGNYGYKDEMTGAGWQTPRTNMESEIPLRHWHLNDPGVVPNLLQTGQGSPTGICVYEGRLLPKAFWDQVIHCDAGPNVVRAYPAKKNGAGYTATELPILTGTRDKWFRPSDVCVAPDGSLIVADWYDPGVGGHRMGDVERGRLFRVAPPKTAYKNPKYDFTSIDGCIEALKSPNLCARYLAWTELHKQGEKAVPSLKTMFKSDKNPRFRARALWLLAKLNKDDAFLDDVGLALDDGDPDIRIVGIRAIRQRHANHLQTVIKMVLEQDQPPEVIRECAIALRQARNTDLFVDVIAADCWTFMAQKYDGKDRWFLEALGIAADGKWDPYLTYYLKHSKSPWVETRSGRDIIWRSRAKQTPQLLAEVIQNQSAPHEELPRYLRAFDFQTSDTKEAALIELAFTPKGSKERQELVATEALSRLKGFDITKNPEQAKALAKVLDANKGTKHYLDLVAKFQVKDRYPELLVLAQEKPQDQLGVEAMRALLAANQVDLIESGLKNKDVKLATATATAVGNSADGRLFALLSPLAADKEQPLEVRRQAVRGLTQVKNGAEMVLKLAREKKLEANLAQSAAAGLLNAPWPEIRNEAVKLFPLPPTKNNQPLPSIPELAKLAGNAQKGRVLFNTEATCAKCHVVNGVGKEVGPNLSEIGSKLAKAALHESILFPSAGISHNYETWALSLTNGTTVTGILVSQTPEEVTIKNNEALVRTFKRDEIEEMAKQPISLMPADVQKLLTQQDLVDVVEYLTTLKKVESASK
ncbi:MAG: NPCBM/NEW2 domain-containing protein [Planctomycetaceae bacterium]|nr:NPCBM/NEW2 domain-containing protein [Planctomycetaceae bacterium]